MAEPLTAEEKSWLRKMQNLANKCPPRFGLYTIGDPSISVFDKTFEHLFDDERDMPQEVAEYDAYLGFINFPTNIHGVCG